MSAETDISAAWINRWEGTPALVAAVPGGLRSDRRAQGQALPGDASVRLPYAILTVTQDRPPKFAHRSWVDYCRVLVEVYGTGKQAIGDVVSLIVNTFRHKEDGSSRLSFSGINANRRHVHTHHGVEDDEQPADQKRHGNVVRVARVAFRVITIATAE